MNMFNISAGVIETDVTDHFPIFAAFETPFYFRNKVLMKRAARRGHINIMTLNYFIPI